MIEIQYIVAFAMGIVNVFKSYLPAPVVPFVTMALTIGLNVANAYLYGDANILLASKEAFIVSGITVGMFAAGDAIRKSDTTPFKVQR